MTYILNSYILSLTLKIIAPVLIIGMAGQASAQTVQHGVHVKAGLQSGGGYTIRNGNDCFVITAKHVVKEDVDAANIITVTDERGVKRSAKQDKVSSTQDLALYRIDDPAGFSCAPRWNDGSSAISDAKIADRIFLLKTDDNGNQSRLPLEYFQDDNATIDFFPGREQFAPQSGDSGSPIFAGVDSLVGIALSVDSQSGVVNVLSQNVINSEFSSLVVTERVVRVIAAPVTQNQNREVRSATLTAMDKLGATGARVITLPNDTNFSKRNPPNYSQLARSADYMLTIDIVELKSRGERMTKSEFRRQNGGAGGQSSIENELAAAAVTSIFGALLGDKSSNRKSPQRNEKINVITTQIDLDVRLIDLRTRSVIRDRVNGSRVYATNDRRQAENAVLNLAIDQSIKNVMKGL